MGRRRLSASALLSGVKPGTIPGIVVSGLVVSGIVMSGIVSGAVPGVLAMLLSLPVCRIGLSGERAAALKANLDLPFNAFGSPEDEEVAPEVIFFFGQMYESDAVVFALDESGSMNQNGRWPLQTREVVRAITQLSDHSEFGVLYYGSRVTPFREKAVRAVRSNKAAATAFVTARNPGGDTCLFEGLIKALSIVRRSGGKHRSVILTSDGRPDVCSTGDRATPAQVEALLQQSLQANPGRAVRVHTVWVGSGTDSAAIAFMKRLAAMHGGTFRIVNR